MSARLVVADRVATPSGHKGDSILIDGEAVVALGSSDEIAAPRAAHYPGATIAPGFRDAHLHPVVYAATLRRVVLKEATDIPDVMSRLAAAADELPAGDPLIAARLDDETLAEGRLPTREDLDRVIADRAVVVHRYCGHIAIANTAALEAAGIEGDSPDPTGGRFDRDVHGVPNGILRETAVSVIGRAIGGRSSGIDPDDLLRAMRGLARLGLTSIGAMVSLELDPWCGESEELERLCDIASDLPVNTHVLAIAEEEGELEAAGERIARAGGRLSFLGLKAFADGSLGGHTAAMNRPFSDRPQERGTLRLDPTWAGRMAQAAIRQGGQVAVHAIGDRANEQVLDLFEGLCADGADPQGLRIEHASVLTESAIDRLAALGITASVQPAFLVSETSWLEKRVGQQRMALTYPFATLRAAGVLLAGGSDSPVEPPNPLWGIAAARDRGGLVPEESLDAASSLELFTNGAARALGESPPLAPGSPADFVVLDVDPLTATPDELRRGEVLATWMDGRPLDLPERPPIWPG